MERVEEQMESEHRGELRPRSAARTHPVPLRPHPVQLYPTCATAPSHIRCVLPLPLLCFVRYQMFLDWKWRSH